MTQVRTKPAKHVARTEALLAAHALAYPGATEDWPWGDHAFKINKKVFLFLNADADGLSVTTKLPKSADAALLLPFAEPTGYGLGRSGWVTARFAPADEVPVELLTAWIDESFRAIAPKTLVKALDGRGAGAAPPARSSKRKPKRAVAKTKRR